MEVFCIYQSASPPLLLLLLRLSGYQQLEVVQERHLNAPV